MKYSESHEWVRLEGKLAVIGITSFAQKELGEIVYLELPKVGTKLKKGDEACILESTKAATDIYTPLTGKIVEVNPMLARDVSLLNNSPEKEGWLFKLELASMKEVDELLDLVEYESLMG